MRSFRFRCFAAALCVGLGSTAPAGAINIVLVYDDLGENPSYDPNGTQLMAIAEAAAARWERLIPSAGTHIVDVSWSELDEGGLGLWKFDPLGNNNLYFDADSTDWFFDSTPNSDSEYEFGDPLDFTFDEGSTLAGETPSSTFFEPNRPDPPAMLEIAYFGNGASGEANEDYDLLSVVLHELGHELGVGGDILSGRYPIDPDHVLGIDGIEVIEGNCEDPSDPGYCEEHGHVAPPRALMSPSTGPGVRTLPSALDVLVAARDSNYESVDLVRKFTGRSGTWGDASDWIGGRVPDASDVAIVAHGGTTTLTGERTADSLAVGRSPSDGPTIGDSTTLAMIGDLTVDHEVRIGTASTIRVDFGAQLIAETLEMAGGELEMVGGTVQLDDGGHTDVDAMIQGRGRLLTDGVLELEGLIAADGDLRLGGSGALLLIRDDEWSNSGILRAEQGDLGIEVDIDADSVGRIEVSGGRVLTALADLSIPSDVQVQLHESGNATAFISSVGAGVDLTISNLLIGEFGNVSPSQHGEILSRTVTLDDRVFIDGDLTLSSPVLTTLRGGLELSGSFSDSTLIQNGDIAVQGGLVSISVDTFDWGNSTSDQTNDLRIGSGSTLDVFVGSFGSASNAFRGELEIDSGVLDVTSDEPWQLAASRTLGNVTTPGGTLALTHGGVSDPIVRGSPFTANSFVVVSGGAAFIESDFTVAPAANVVVFGGASSLFLAGHTTLDGGALSGLGTLVQRGDIDVISDTTIETGTFNWGNSFGLDFNTLTVESGATLTVASQDTGDLDNTFRGGVVLNGGALVVNTDLPWSLPKGSAFLPGAGLTLNFDGEAPRVVGQSLTVGGAITVTGGAAHIDSDLSMLDGSIDVAAGATLNLNGSNNYRGTFTGDGIYRHNGSALLGSALAIPNLVQNGRLTVINPNGEALLDTQTLVFENDSDTRVFSDLRIRGDALLMPGAGFTGSKTLVIDAAGSLSGGEDLGVSLRNEGVLRPGFSPGALDIGGDFATLGTLEIELGGTLAGLTHDALAVDGDVTLAGTLELILYGGFSPAPGDAFDILDWTGSLGGAFSNFVYPLGSGPAEWDFSALYTTGEMRFIPEPGTAALLALGLAALRARRRPATRNDSRPVAGFASSSRCCCRRSEQRGTELDL